MSQRKRKERGESKDKESGFSFLLIRLNKDLIDNNKNFIEKKIKIAFKRGGNPHIADQIIGIKGIE